MKKYNKILFFQILQYSIGASDKMPVGISSEEWERIYEMARQQSLLGVLFYGIQKGGMEKPERKLFLKWYSMSEKIKQGNMKANRAAVELTQIFLKNGFRTCILKGQGNTLNYPDPYIRNSGDVDIWLEGGRKKIMALVDKKWSGMLQRYHHVEIPNYNGVAVEVHFTPSYMHSFVANRRLQKWFAEQEERQFANAVELPDNAGTVCVPTLEFNLVYQLDHIYKHLFSEGIGLRQLMDYYFLLKGICSANKDYITGQLRFLGLYKFAGAVMYVMQEVFALDDKYMIAEPNIKEGKFLLKEILVGGNFGKYDTRLGDKEKESKMFRNFRMTLRNMRYVFHYPSEALSEPLFRMWFFFWRLLNK